eukprot:4955690-Amphidinium_carterae.2
MVRNRAIRGLELKALKIEQNFSASGAYIAVGTRRLCELNGEFQNDRRVRFGLWLEQGMGEIQMNSPIRPKRGLALADEVQGVSTAAAVPAAATEAAFAPAPPDDD